MPKRTRIYTRTGDDGTTGLIGGRRIKKSAPRIETYGTVDELSSAIGVVRAALDTAGARDERLDAWLAWIQDRLFNLGSSLAAMPGERPGSLPQLEAGDVATLERAIDEADADLEPLHAFVLPGGSTAGAQLHVARTVCRRAERLLVALRDADGGVTEDDVRFLNRLADALFVWSRWTNAAAGIADRTWTPSSSPPPPVESS